MSLTSDAIADVLSISDAIVDAKLICNVIVDAIVICDVLLICDAGLVRCCIRSKLLMP